MNHKESLSPRVHKTRTWWQRWKDQYTLVMLESREKVALKIDPKNESGLFEDAARKAEAELLKNPDINYALNYRLSSIYLHSQNPSEAVFHAGYSIDQHPDRTEEGGFKGYLDHYMTALKAIPEIAEGKSRTKAYREAINRLSQYTTAIPRMEYVVEGHIGWCFDQLGERLQALPHHEKGILLHPNSDGSSDFEVYRNNFITDARLLAQEALSRSKGRQKQRYIDQLVAVVNSTARVGMRYPELTEVRHEHIAAYGWYVRAVGAKNVKPGMTLEITRN